jgi:DNA-binding LacI/PurR family transcriptional regulator
VANRVTIQDVARAAGVSPMTVSHVLNAHPHVADATRTRVLEKIDEMDYRVNVAARNLRSGKTGTIGLAVPEVDRPYFGQLAAEIIKAAERRGMRVVIEQTGAARESELDALSLSRKRMYDGLILSTVGLGQSDVDLLKVDYPVVILGERIFEGPVDHVAMPNVEGARAAVRHLIDQGARHIAMLKGVDGDEITMSKLRYTGYRSALESAGLEFDPALAVELDVFTMETGETAIRTLTRTGIAFDGLFCITDTVAIGALRGLAGAGLAVPSQVKVVSFDNIREAAFTIPSLSSVDPDHAMMAEKAIGLLMARIERGASEEHEEFVSSFRVVKRESSAAA